MGCVLPHEVVFIGKGVEQTVSFAAPTSDQVIRTVIRTGRDLGCRFAVAADAWDDAKNCPVWAVFDLRKAGIALPDQCSLPIPTFRCSSETPDGAVMWVQHRMMTDA